MRGYSDEDYYGYIRDLEIELRRLPLEEWRQTFRIFNSGGLRYITGCKGGDPVVFIPGRIAGSPVFGVAEKAFSRNDFINELLIGTGLSEIGCGAFRGCKNLARVIIPKGVKTIREKAFEGCENLSTLIIGNGVEEICDEAFKNCVGLREITIPGTVGRIGANAFSGCRSLKRIVFENGVKRISGNAFRGCDSLRYVDIPESVVEIGHFAFGECNKLERIDVNKDNLSYSSKNGLLLSKDGTELIFCPRGRSGAVDFLEGVTSIRYYAFCKCAGITGVVIPGDVHAIPPYAFQGCSALSEITIREGVSSIGRYAFFRCGNVTEVVIPGGLTAIGDHAFCECSRLKSVTIPESVTAIGFRAFYRCGDPIIIKGAHLSYAEKYSGENRIPFMAVSFHKEECLSLEVLTEQEHNGSYRLDSDDWEWYNGDKLL